MYKLLEKGQIVYYARIIPTVEIYEVIELKLRTVENTYFVGVEESTQHAYLFGNSNLGKLVFLKRNDALKLVKEAEKSKQVVSGETYYEEY